MIRPICSLLVFAAFAAASCTEIEGRPRASGETMAAFESETALENFLDRRRAAFERSMAVAEASMDASTEAMVLPAPTMSLDLPAPEAAAQGDDQITNVQEAGVDEGGIVKVHGDHLVILRRGRLSTIRVGGGALAPADTIDAFPPDDRDPGDTWYDEMLIAGDMVVVVGYSYGNTGTEISRFTIESDGGLSYRDTHNLRSADYYSSRNYASRLIGDKLVFYAPLPLAWSDNWRESVPAVRRRRSANDDAGVFEPIAGPGDLYAPAPVLDDREIAVDTLHTVTECDLGARELACDSIGVFGGWGRSFYVSPEAVYVWTGPGYSGGDAGDTEESWVYRLPLDGAAPQSLRVKGDPIDQFSFREDRADGILNVVVRAGSGGDAMWNPEVSAGDVALLRLPLESFGDGSDEAHADVYRKLPTPSGYAFQNRFVGNHLLYAAGSYGERDAQRVLFAVPLDGKGVERIALEHGVTRLDAMGRDGVAIGQNDDGALGFSAIGLDAASGDARLEDTYLLAAASEGENRSQAFFYKPDPGDPTGDSGTLGLPVSLRRPVREFDSGGPPSPVPVAPPAPYGQSHFLGSGSAILFLNRKDRELSPAGQLDAWLRVQPRDDCKASCVDWYGNARPIFLRDRIFALLGYELVEGRLDRSGRIREVRRVDFAP